MSQDRVCRLRAWYDSKRDHRDLEINLSDTGDYVVLGQGDWHYVEQFPVRERMSREASVDRGLIEPRIDELLAICQPDWYHHYRQPKGYLGHSLYTGYRWGMRVEFVSGDVERWEGEGVAPPDFMDAFEKLYACGMPRPPMMPECWTLRSVWDDTRGDTLIRLSSYQQLLDRAAGPGQPEMSSEDTRLLLREFIDDIRRYLRRNCKDFSLETALEVWGLKPTLACLSSVDVSHAPRMEMLTLYAALAAMGNAEGVAAKLHRDKTIARWSERLEELPAEEEQESKRLEREGRRALRLAIDRALQDRIAEGGEFTIREVADEVGVKVSRVTSRVQTLVKSGALKTVFEGRPRRYQAA